MKAKKFEAAEFQEKLDTVRQKSVRLRAKKNQAQSVRKFIFSFSLEFIDTKIHVMASKLRVTGI